MTYEPAVFGSNCNITLTHPDINDGNPIGFILEPSPRKENPAVYVRLERTSDYESYLFVSFSVVLSDSMRSPDGAIVPWTKAEMYELLLSVLDQGDRDDETITLVCSAGVYTGLAPFGSSVYLLEALPNKYKLDVVLTRDYTYFRPPPVEDFLASYWDGVRTWETSYWR